MKDTRQFMRFFYGLVFALLSSFGLYAQKELNVWAFGNGAGLDFNSGSPVPDSTAINSYRGCASICNTEGQLLFYTDGNNIYNRNHLVMPAGAGLLPSIVNTPGTQSAVIVGVPGEESRYYVFSLEGRASGRLYYSIVDMNLAGGLGDVVAGQQAVPLDSALSSGMSVVAGNNYDIWLMAISREAAGNPRHTQYKAWRITEAGIEPPVISLIPGSPFHSFYGSYLLDRAYIKFSPGRRNKMAVATNTNEGSGENLFLYDFDPATGLLSNKKVLATNLNVGVLTFGARYGNWGLCFSPDGYKLYVSMGTARGGMIIQFDHVQTDNMIDLLLSSRLIYAHPPHSYMFQRFSAAEIRPGPDDKVYVGRGPLDGGAFNTLHVINHPNLPGAACDFVPDVITLLPGTANYVGLPNDVVRLRMMGAAYEQIVCFRDSIVLSPGDSTSQTFRWDNGDTSHQRVVNQSGTYLVRYQDGKYPNIWYRDTFYVTISSSQIPEVFTDTVCAGAYSTAWAVPPDTLLFRYTWLDDTGAPVSSRESRTGDTVRGLTSGKQYALHLEERNTGCDTTIYFYTQESPKPELEVSPSHAVIKYGDSIQLHVSGAYMYVWYPSGSLSNAEIPNPVASPLQPTVYTVIGIDEKSGCLDTAFVTIDIDYTMPDFIPNAFSPNGDGVNDVFKIEGITYQKVLAFRIYNRYGEEVFSTVDPQRGWNGTRNNRPCDVGTYFYLIELGYPDGTTKAYKGDVVLIR